MQSYRTHLEVTSITFYSNGQILSNQSNLDLFPDLYVTQLITTKSKHLLYLLFGSLGVLSSFFRRPLLNSRKNSGNVNRKYDGCKGGPHSDRSLICRYAYFLGPSGSSTSSSSSLTSSSTLFRISKPSTLISATSVSFLGIFSFSFLSLCRGGALRFGLGTSLENRDSEKLEKTAMKKRGQSGPIISDTQIPLSFRVIALVIYVVSKRNIFITGDTFLLLCTTERAALSTHQFEISSCAMPSIEETTGRSTFE